MVAYWSIHKIALLAHYSQVDPGTRREVPPMRGSFGTLQSEEEFTL